MSFILDALKRSENERQRQTGPGLATAPEGGGERRRSPWVAVVAILLLINLGVLGFLLSRPPATPESAPSATAPAAAPARSTDRGGGTIPLRGDPPSPTADTTVAAARRTAPVKADRPAPTPSGGEPVTASGAMTAAPRAAAEPPPEREVRDLGDEVLALEEITADASAEPSPPSGRPEPGSAAPAPAARPATDSLPTVQELTLRGEFSGRPLHLDLHVYYDDPARRLVFINGSKYREGERIDDGLRVAEIVPDGVVLDDGRQRFLLPST
jgi:general secretion pathway protein B